MDGKMDDQEFKEMFGRGSTRTRTRTQEQYSYSGTVLVLEWSAMSELLFDHGKRDVYRLAIDYVAFAY